MNDCIEHDTTTTVVESPLGALLLSATNGALTGLDWTDDRVAVRANTPVLAEAGAELAAYFAGALKVFTVDCLPAGDPFERAVWAAMCDIPYGATATYGDLAAIVGKPARAVGGACGRNPIPVIIPCHRVVGAGGRMVGYSGKGGVETKQWLLRHEGALLL